jgi:hypothetical protein
MRRRTRRDATHRATWPPVARHTARVGYNPYRKYRASAGDYVLVGAALIVAIGLALWGIFG